MFLIRSIDLVMETIRVAGSPVAYLRQGRGAPLVMLHNGGTSHAIWRHTAEAMASRFEIFAPDLAGFGASATPDERLTLDGYAAMVGALVDAHQLAPVSLAGNCMGSAIALRFAMLRPSAVRALVLVNPLTEATLGAGAFAPWLRLRRRAPRISELASRAVKRLRLPPWAAARTLSLQLARTGEGIEAADAGALCACYDNRDQLSSLLAVVDDIASYAQLDRFEPGPEFPPICTIWGLENRVLSPEAGRQLNTTLRPARQVWLEKCGHLPMLERPAAVAGAIDDFLAEHDDDLVRRRHLQSR